jgi:hypothetical protein
MRLIVVLCLISAAPAFAHRMIVDPRVRGDHIHVEVFFEDGTLAQDTKVTVVAGDKIVAEGRTDEKGIWNCPLPAAGTYLVKAENAGHAAMDTVVVPEAAAAVKSAPADEQLSDHSDKTGTQWLGLAIGLGLIGVLGLLWLVARRLAKNQSRARSGAE